MDFGKLPDISRVNFQLPPDRPESLELLTSRRRSSPPRIYIGCPVWSAKSWVGTVYPPKTPVKDYLFHYSRQFNAIELNSTHYGVPTHATIAQWRDSTPEGFQFCPKFPQEISHHRMLRATDPLVRAFCATMQGFGNRLGPSFLQLPPVFAPFHLPLLAQFLAAVPSGFRVAVEFRHSQWFSGGKLRPEAAGLLERAGATAVMTDVAGRRDVLHMSLTNSTAMIRFTGNELHPTDYSRLDEWVAKLKGWFEAGLSELYFFTHQPDETTAPQLVTYITQKLNTRCGLTVREWKPYEGEAQLAFFS
jgi:uncharacterized protein YecE (DUF72 family)